jgi:hypothetical protein
MIASDNKIYRINSFPFLLASQSMVNLVPMEKVRAALRGFGILICSVCIVLIVVKVLLLQL